MYTHNDNILNIWREELPWDRLSGCNILVTGATGLIGGCLVEALMSCPWLDFDVYASGRNVERARKRFDKYWNDYHFHFLKYDATSPLDTDISYDYIIHAASGAAPIDFSEHPVEVMEANLKGVSNLVKYGINHNVRRLLYISSGEVYGEGDGRMLTEEYQGYVNINSPRSCYPSAKRASETLCTAYAAEYGIDIVIARPCHIYGPHFTERDNRVYAQFIRNVLKGESIVMKSTGEQYRSWCYVVDCVSALLFILLRGEKGHAYNIADESSNLTIKELADMIAKIGNQKVKMDLPDDSEKRGYNPVHKSVFNTNKLRNLGWEICGTMTEKMISTIMACDNRYDRGTEKN